MQNSLLYILKQAAANAGMQSSRPTTTSPINKILLRGNMGSLSMHPNMKRTGGAIHPIAPVLRMQQNLTSSFKLPTPSRFRPVLQSMQYSGQPFGNALQYRTAYPQYNPLQVRPGYY